MIVISTYDINMFDAIYDNANFKQLTTNFYTYTLSIKTLATKTLPKLRYESDDNFNFEC
jgi:hypothetical protein